MHRSFFKYWHKIPTRWMDQDAFGHVNNVQYYSFMDTAVCTFLRKNKAFEQKSRPFVVHSSCNYKKPIAFPSEVEIGVSVIKIGKTSSCIYKIGLFEEGADVPNAVGNFVHVWTDMETEKPTVIPQAVREAYEAIQNHEQYHE
eukprot:TRINITY_DN22207_c0_g1_i1.p2 TRINITY_DN22207_c0_g1~~TRINITY_DN22207_c0_g1_i1.p2  ORF type:complete len:143 (+),score=40.58 TRINITY_DN22207_c0_g1_i1:422-850(+)